MLITLFARKELTQESLSISHGLRQKMDTVIYRDKACKEVFVRWPWHLSNCPDRRFKRVTLNCYRWQLQWVPCVVA
jgi:hypothetical protein